MVRRASNLRGRKDRRDYPLSHGRELSWVGRVPGPGRQFKLRLAASSQTCFKTNVLDDPPVVDSSLGSKFPRLHRTMEF